MEDRIVVALKARDRIQEIIPILQKIAKPGIKVMFLVSYPVDPRAWLRDHRIVTESARKAKACFRRAAREYAVNEDLQFILMSAGRGEAIMGVVRLMTLLLRRIKRSNFSSFLLYHPRPRAQNEQSTAAIS